MARMISRLVSQLRGVVVFSLFVCSVNHTSGKFLLMLMCCGWKQMVFVGDIFYTCGSLRGFGGTSCSWSGIYGTHVRMLPCKGIVCVDGRWNV